MAGSFGVTSSPLVTTDDTTVTQAEPKIRSDKIRYLSYLYLILSYPSLSGALGTPTLADASSMMVWLGHGPPGLPGGG